jgi:enterochelin esterase family protein
VEKRKKALISGITGQDGSYLAELLLAKGYDVRYQQFNSGHDYLNWRGTLADGLIALVGTDTTRSSSR